MGSLGQIGGDDTQVKARKLMGDLEIMKDEIHELVQDKNKSIFSRSTEDMKKLENENSDLKRKLEEDKQTIKILETDKDFIKTKLEEEIKVIKAIPPKVIVKTEKVMVPQPQKKGFFSKLFRR